MPLIGHKKSRNGCTSCKRRRVKCDEQQPCRNCVRRREQCSLETRSPLPGQLSTFTDRGDHVLSSPSEDWMHEMYLMHHFTAFTAESLNGSPAYKRIWKFEIPKQALTHRFLMHGIIAAAALHLADLCPSRSSINVLLYKRHQRLALTSMHRLLLDINEDNCNAVFPCSSLASIFSLYEFSHDLEARPQDTASLCDRIFQLFAVTRGVREILTPTYVWIREGPLQGLLEGHWNFPDADFELPEAALVGLEKMRDFVLSNCLISTQRMALENAYAGLKALYHEAAFTLDNNSTLESGNILKYIASVPSEYITMLQKGEENSLIMFAYYVILTRAALRRWFCNDSIGQRGLEMVRRILPPDLHSWLDWPTEQFTADLPALRRDPTKKPKKAPSPKTQSSPRCKNKGRSPVEMQFLIQHGYLDPALSSTSPLPEDPTSRGKSSSFNSPA